MQPAKSSGPAPHPVTLRDTHIRHKNEPTPKMLGINARNNVDAPATLCSLFHPEVRKRAINAPIIAYPFALAAATSPLASLLLVRKEKSRGTPRERMER